MNSDFCPVTKFKKVTHVIFDLDGTILDTEEIYIKTLMDIAAHHGKVFTNEIYNEIAGCRLKEAADIAIRLMDLPLTQDEFAKKFRQISNLKIPAATLMPGAEKMIRHLHSNRIPIAVATSSTQEDFEFKTRFHKEIFDLFHHCVCGGSDPEVTHGKPFPDIFLICASRFSDKPDPSACLVFEDAPNGVQAALAAGMQVVMFPNEHIPHYKWKSATLRLNSFEYMVPEAFGLPPFPTLGDHNFSATRSTNISMNEVENSPTEQKLTEVKNNSATEKVNDIRNYPTEEEIIEGKNNSATEEVRDIVSNSPTEDKVRDIVSNSPTEVSDVGNISHAEDKLSDVATISLTEGKLSDVENISSTEEKLSDAENNSSVEKRSAHSTFNEK